MSSTSPSSWVRTVLPRPLPVGGRCRAHTFFTEEKFSLEIFKKEKGLNFFILIKIKSLKKRFNFEYSFVALLINTVIYISVVTGNMYIVIRC